MAADDNHPEPGLGALFVVGDRLLGEDTFMRASDPSGADRPEDDAVLDRRIADAPGRKQMLIAAGVGHGRFLNGSMFFVGRGLLAGRLRPQSPNSKARKCVAPQ
jgi:hypothetical protein